MGLCFSNWIEVYWLKKPGCQAFFNTLSNAEMASYGRLSDFPGTPANISAMWYSPRFRQKSEQLMQRESRTSGELLLPVSGRPSHWEMISQRNNGAPSRIPNSISPWWFTWQTVAWLLCSWILTHAMPWRHLLIEIAPAQFIKGYQTDHMSHKLSEKLHKLGQCQKL